MKQIGIATRGIRGFASFLTGIKATPLARPIVRIGSTNATRVA